MDWCHGNERGSDQDEDVLLTLRMQVVSKLRQVSKLDFIIGEVFLVLHVIDVCVLNVLQKKERHTVKVVQSKISCFCCKSSSWDKARLLSRIGWTC